LTAIEIISSLTQPVTEKQFVQLIRDFASHDLKQSDFFARLNRHRNPLVLLNEKLRELFEKDLKIQSRMELQDVDPINNSIGFATSVISHLHEANKNLTTYGAVCHYCQFREKDLTTIAVHVAEYCSVRILEKRVHRWIRIRERKCTPSIGSGPIANPVQIINPNFAVEAMESVSKGQPIYIESSKMRLEHYYTEPHPNYVQPPNYPFCCDFHRGIYQAATESYQRFPDCCAAHQRLKTAPWFSKDQYAYSPLKVVNTVDYTINWINNHLDSENWYKAIQDYLEYTIRSYGQLPDGHGPAPGRQLYISNISQFIAEADHIPEIKRLKLADYLKIYVKPAASSLTGTDLNLLIDYYRRWLRVFPFELDLFKNIRPYFEQRIPIIKGVGTTNGCNQLTAVPLKNQKELKEFLFETTIKLVQLVNTKDLFEQGKLTNIGKTQIDLVNARRQMEINDYATEGWKDRQSYVRFLKKWFADEQRYLKELKKLLSDSASEKSIRQAIVRWIEGLQRDDVNEGCMRNAKSGNPKEKEFQYSLKSALHHTFPTSQVISEEEKGTGNIDLRVIDPVIGSAVIELKGWWNRSKTEIVSQICSYLTDFDIAGHVIILNDLKTTAILKEYQAVITGEKSNYVEGSWRLHKTPKSGFSYFESRHRTTIAERTLFHYILDTHASNPPPKRKSVSQRNRKR
jgi:hypothetical protein